LELYTELIKEFPNDPIGEMYIERCKDYLKTPPPADWDGVTHMKTK
jgi:adenylate cyclase